MCRYYNNRALTMLMYLNDVEEGGETIFPLAYPPLKLRARAGNAIIWRNCIPEVIPFSCVLTQPESC